MIIILKSSKLIVLSLNSPPSLEFICSHLKMFILCKKIKAVMKCVLHLTEILSFSGLRDKDLLLLKLHLGGHHFINLVYVTYAQQSCFS
jgi:hypothetical protein